MSFLGLALVCISLVHIAFRTGHWWLMGLLGLMYVEPVTFLLAGAMLCYYLIKDQAPAIYGMCGFLFTGFYLITLL